MRDRLKILILPLLLIFALTNANAKWWIFGQNESSVNVSYLYINSLSFDSTKKELVFSKDSLDNGYLHIRGRANAGSSSIGKVLISTDGKKSWKKAKLASDGSFDFAFEPELGKKYDIYVQIIDTTGKSNDMEDTHKIVSISNKNMREIVSDSLNHLKDAYSNEDVSTFMKYVSSDFTGDDATLELALRKDFSAFDNIQINFTINSIAYQDGRYFVSIGFNRTLESTKDGGVYNDSGITEFSFADGKNGAMLYSMKNPLIFGLSDASEVADGSLVSAENSNVITVDSSGNISEKSIVDIVNNTRTNNGGSNAPVANIESGSFTLSYDELPNGDNQHKGFLFDSGTIVDISNFAHGLSDMYLEINVFWPDSGAMIQDLGVDGSGGVDFNHMTVPTAGYSSQLVGAVGNDDHVYAVKLPNNTYAIVKNISSSLVTDGLGNPHSSVTCDYKYRSDGGLDF